MDCLLFIYAALALCFCSWSAHATVFRALTGEQTTINSDWTATEGGWTFPAVTNGSPLKPQLSSVHFAGTQSIAFQVITNQSGDTERVEYKILQASDTNGLHFDNARYCGFAFKLAANAAPFNSSCIFWQAWQGSPWGPPAMLKFATDSSPPYRIRFTIRNMATGPDSSTSDLELWAASIIQPDTWYSVVVYLRPRHDTNGVVRLWINGTNYLNWSGPIGYDPAQVVGTYNGLDLKNGIYQPDANNGRTIYFDEIRVADTFSEASPLRLTNHPTLSPPTRTNDAWRMWIGGNSGALYLLEAASDLGAWTEVLATNPPALPCPVFDAIANDAGRRFYRVRSEP